MVASTAALTLAVGGAMAWLFLQPKAEEPVAVQMRTPTPSPSPTPTPVTKASPLTGVQVAPELADRPIISVIIENSTDARPQSGLQDAGIVYEALAEGGITRFQTFFLDSQPKSLGPVRSLRPYFVDWGLGFGAPVAHAGGSATALSLATTTGLRSLNALVIGAPTFYRTSDRVAPHNLYTSSALLDALLSKRGLDKAPTFTPLPRKADAPLATPTHTSIAIPYSGTAYNAAYVYDPATNDYARSVGGKPHVDRNTGKQIHVKNVVVEYTPVVAAGDAKGHVNITTVGQGKGIVFRDGDAIPCTWVKDARTSQTKLLDASGAQIPLNAGNTWFSIVPTGKTVTY